MNREKAIIIFRCKKKNIDADLEVPLDINTTELLVALNAAFDLSVDTSDVKNCYLKAELPTVLLRGTKTLAELGVRNGTVINYT